MVGSRSLAGRKHRFSRPWFAAAVGTVLAVLLQASPAAAGSTTTPYTSPGYLTELPFGAHSHWIQPWRSSLETMPASVFVNGVGMNANVDPAQADLVMHMLASHGIHHARVEIGWSSVNYYDETQLVNAPAVLPILAAAAKYGVRPLILLNGNAGFPCPAITFTHVLPTGAAQGATTITLDDTSNLVPGFSGISNLTGYWLAEDLVTAVNGNVVTLSKPLPNALPAGAVNMATLKYRPFSVPGSADYNNTMAGWNRYTDTVAHTVENALGTTNAADKGFDLEVWNELTFGSQFLNINNYYAGSPYNYNQYSIWSDLVRDTSDHLDAEPALFTGVQVGDGMANTIPWPASSLEPDRVRAIDKHPYAGRHTYPQEPPPGGQEAINALGAVDAPGSFVPSYSALFPEYFGTALQTETMVRDMGPMTNSIYGTQHGRYARTINGQVAPVSTWITEVNEGPVEDNPSISVPDALALKAKTTARYLAFYLNKGVSQLDFYAANGGDKDLGMVLDSFLAYADQPGATYPADDSASTSPALLTTQRMVARMSAGMDPSLTPATTRQISVGSISDTHNHFQFAGDGTAAHPTLYDRDVFSALPFQVNSSRFVIPYYVQTRDYTKSLTPEQFTVDLHGMAGSNATVTAYDPINDTAVPVQVTSASSTALTVQLTATDYPYLLTVQENPAPVAPITVAVMGTDNQMYVNKNGAGYQPYGGILTAAPAVVEVPHFGAASTPLYIATGTDHRPYVRSDTEGFTALSSVYSYCIDNPAATVDSAGNLVVACQGSDHGIWTATASIPSSGLPALGGWTPLGGQSYSGPALAIDPQTNLVNVAVTGTDSALYRRPVTSGAWFPFAGSVCVGHPAAGTSQGVEYLACHGSDSALWWTSNAGAGFGGFQSAGGQLIDGPGLAAAADEVTFLVEGAAGQAYQRTVATRAPGLSTGWAQTGLAILHGGGATAD